MHIDISIDGETWHAVANLETLVNDAVKAAQDVLADRSLDDAELSVAFVSDDTIRALNRDYRGKDSATNVLSFPNDMAVPAGAPRMLGDVILAYETVVAEAAAQDKPVADHIRHLVVHGFLHLLGYDHESNAQAEHMESVEIRVLENLQVANPYLSAEIVANHEAAGRTGKPR